jgi:hypothetical protein
MGGQCFRGILSFWCHPSSENRIISRESQTLENGWSHGVAQRFRECLGDSFLCSPGTSRNGMGMAGPNHRSSAAPLSVKEIARGMKVIILRTRHRCHSSEQKFPEGYLWFRIDVVRFCVRLRWIPQGGKCGVSGILGHRPVCCDENWTPPRIGKIMQTTFNDVNVTLLAIKEFWGLMSRLGALLGNR